MLLHQQAIEQATNATSKVKLYASHIKGETAVPCHLADSGHSSEVPELCFDIEEADGRIVPHAMHAVKHGTRRIVVLSPDTDVCILMMYYWKVYQSNGLQQLWVKGGGGDSTRYIPIHALALTVRADLCKVLPTVHTLTGCDYTSKVGTKPAALKVNPAPYLKGFGLNANDPNIDTLLERSEEYLTQVLKKGTTCKTMDQLRIQIYHSRKGVCLEQLPPTSHAIRNHILRSFYATYQMISLLAEPNTLQPTSYGFKEDDDLLVPEIGTCPIPEEYVMQCNCMKCATNRCGCRSNGLPCCRFCKCQSKQEQDTTSSCKNPGGCA